MKTFLLNYPQKTLYYLLNTMLKSQWFYDNMRELCPPLHSKNNTIINAIHQMIIYMDLGTAIVIDFDEDVPKYVT
jgi:hypothetical protein